MKYTYDRATAHLAAGFVRRHRCSTCWGVLVEQFAPGGGSTVECAKADDECDKAGFVTLYYVDNRRGQDLGDLFEAQANLPFLKPTSTKNADELINDILGG